MSNKQAVDLRCCLFMEPERAASAVRAWKITALFVDTAPRPNGAAKELAQMMNAQYIPLPFAEAHVLSDIVRANRGVS